MLYTDRRTDHSQRIQQVKSTTNMSVFIKSTLYILDPIESGVTQAIAEFLSDRGVTLTERKESDLVVNPVISKKNDYAQGVFSMNAEVQVQFLDSLSGQPINVIKLRGSGTGDSPVATAKALITDLIQSLEAPLADAVSNSVDHYQRVMDRAN